MKIQWCEDSSGNLTCHSNEPRLSYKESMLGRILHRGNDWWVEVLPEKMLGPFKHVAGAMDAMRRAVNGIEVDPWDR